MKNYYILTVDSFQDTFTRIDAGKDFYFELSVQEYNWNTISFAGRRYCYCL